MIIFRNIHVDIFFNQPYIFSQHYAVYCDNCVLFYFFESVIRSFYNAEIYECQCLTNCL